MPNLHPVILATLAITGGLLAVLASFSARMLAGDVMLWTLVLSSGLLALGGGAVALVRAAPLKRRKDDRKTAAPGAGAPA